MMVELKNTSRVHCIIGDPVLHSKSPVIYNALVNHFGLDMVYLCQPVAAEHVKDFVAAARTLGYGGFNVTMPHKKAIFELVDELDEEARICESVNTVAIRDGKLYGYSTDGGGFCRSLRQSWGSVKGQSVVLMGAGGAAKPAIYHLLREGVAHITVCNRTIEKAEILCRMDASRMTAMTLEKEGLCKAASQAQLLINATSLGMVGNGEHEDFSFLEHLPKKSMVYDFIYYPDETMLLKKARELGLQTGNGMGMLIHQGILAMLQYTQQEMDEVLMEKIMRDALEEALKNERA